MIQEFKVHPMPFRAIWEGDKRAEYRDLTDRPDYSPFTGDFFWLREWDGLNYTGAKIWAEVTHVQCGYGMPAGHFMMSLRVLRKIGDRPLFKGEMPYANRNTFVSG